MLAELLDAWAEKDPLGLHGFDEWYRVLQDGRRVEASAPGSSPPKGKKQAARGPGDKEGERVEAAASAARGSSGKDDDEGADKVKEEREEESGPQVRLRLVIPLAGAGMIVGKQGKTIKGINSKTGAYAALQKDPLESDPARKELIIKGTRAQAYTAKDELLNVMLQWLRNAPEEEGGGTGTTRRRHGCCRPGS